MRDYALVIGIESYVQTPEAILRPLNGAHDDAREFADWLCRTFGFDPKGPNFRLLLSDMSDNDPANALPTKQKIDDAFLEIISAAKAAQKEGTPPRRLYVYFVGHGAMPEENQQEIVGLLLVSAALRPSECLSGASYRDALSRGPLFPEQLFFFDCCRNMDATFLPQTAPFRVPPGDAPYQHLYYAAKRETMANRRPLYRSGGERGFFTEALLEGLSGKAAEFAGADAEGKPLYQVTTDSLSNYLYNRVRELAKSQGRTQIPGYSRDEATPRLIIVDNVPPPRVVQLQVETERMSGIIALNTYLPTYKSGNSWPVINGQANLNLGAGTYIFEAVDGDLLRSRPQPITLRGDATGMIALEKFLWD